MELLTQITGPDLALIGFLAFLEGILSIDNALVLAMMARHLPAKERRHALTYGLLGSVFFRLLALSFVTQLIQWTWVKYLGGGYLVVVAIKHFASKKSHEDASDAVKKASFWKTVFLIELMDIAFAVDSILAAVAVSKKLWVVFTGGMMGVILMRFAASYFLLLLEKFPRFETTAFLLVGTIGGKLILEAAHIPGVAFHSSHDPGFWAFWSTMLLCVLFGFLPAQKKKKKI